MKALSDQQKEIVDLPLDPICVTACAGSGKTLTAVHRLRHVRSNLVDPHGVVVLLSFSNVAVDTFRREYHRSVAGDVAHERTLGTEIDTVDAFLTSNILRPHAHRTMNAPRTAFLVNGREPFLSSFTVWDGSRSYPASRIRATFNGKQTSYQVMLKHGGVSISNSSAESAIAKLGRIGAYTHSLGRYWALRTLREQPMVLRAMARKYPHIIVDEAQDIGSEHQAILEELIASGVKVSLIGDKHQGIFEFSGATGVFIECYGRRAGVTPKELTRNFRSVPDILGIANKISGRADGHDRDPPNCLNGAYILPYKLTERDNLLSAFASMAEAAKVSKEGRVVICRSTELVRNVSGEAQTPGQGSVRLFAMAVVRRDKFKDYAGAFDHTCTALLGVLAEEYRDLAVRLRSGNMTAEERAIRRIIWSFVKDPDCGLPDGTLAADKQWHPLLLERVRKLLARLESEFGLKPADKIGNRLAKKKLSSRPIVETADIGAMDEVPTRITTVHQVKGESIEAVLYVADKKQIRALLDGTNSENGRIGYVAVTRARNLFVLGVPQSSYVELESDLLACGFKKPD